MLVLGPVLSMFNIFVHSYNYFIKKSENLDLLVLALLSFVQMGILWPLFGLRFKWLVKYNFAVFFVLVSASNVLAVLNFTDADDNYIFTHQAVQNDNFLQITILYIIWCALFTHCQLNFVTFFYTPVYVVTAVLVTYLQDTDDGKVHSANISRCLTLAVVLVASKYL